jgi:serine phosphatase RsbU (regulator of sigma subunit)
VFGRGRASSEGRTGGQPGTPPKPSRFALSLAAILFLVTLILPQVPFFEILELKTRDYRLRWRGVRAVSDELVVIEIEEATLKHYDNEWPIPRDQYALMLFALREWGAKVVGLDLWFSGPDRFDARHDTLLAAVTSENERFFHAVYLPLTLEKPDAIAGWQPDPDSLLSRLFLPKPGDLDLMTTFRGHIDLPDVLLEEVPVLGHIALSSDADGVIRRIPLLINHEEYLIPSLSLLMATGYLDTDWKEARIEGRGPTRGRRLVLGGASDTAIPVDRHGRAIINFPGDYDAFEKNIRLFINVANSAQAWLNGEDVPADMPQPEDFEGKMVLICNTAVSIGVADFGPTPFDPVFPLAYAHASMMNSTLEGDFLRDSPLWMNIAILAAIALVLALVLPPLSPSVLALVALGSLLFVTVQAWVTLFFAGVQIPLMQPYFLIAHLSVGILLQGYLVRDRERRAAEHELSIAHKIQQDLLPKEPLEAGRVRVWGVNLPCFAIGGDYFDYFSAPDGQIALAIGDVSGKGVPAALLMSNVQAILRGECSRGGKVTEVLENANNLLMHSIAGSNKFITFFFATLDPATHRMCYSNAGHNPPLVVRADGRLEKLETGGLLLGIFPMATYEEGQLQLEPGDILVLFTDGVTEAEDRAKNQYGDEPFEELVVKLRHLGAREIGERIREEILQFSKGIHPVDDLTVVVVKVEEQVAEAGGAESPGGGAAVPEASAAERS